MSSTPEADFAELFKAATQTLLGGLATWGLTCSLAGAIAEIAVHGDVDFDWSLAFLWVWHLAFAGIGFWGLLVILIHGFCVSALVHGANQVLAVIVTAFIAQLTTSTIVIVVFEQDRLLRALAVWTPFAVISGVYLSVSLRRQGVE